MQVRDQEKPAQETALRILDGDNHYYEAYDSFTRYMDSKHMKYAVHVKEDSRGRNIVMVGDEPLKSNPAHPQDFVAPPGSLLNFFANKDNSLTMSEYNVKNKMRAEDCQSFVDVNARLEFMDNEGVEAAMLYPSLGVMVEQQLAHSAEATYANLCAFNRWLEDDWGYATQGRIFSVPMLSLIDLDLALAELDRVLKAGARAIHLRTGPAFGRSHASAYFDPFWARLEEANVPLAMHSSFSQYHELFSVHWGEKPNPTYTEITPFQSYLGTGARPMMDTLAAMVLQGLFNRFPKLKVLAVEGGSFWLGDLMKQMDKGHLTANGSKLAPGLKAKPSEILAQHLYIAPFPEDDVIGLAEFFPTDHILLGSDYPHPEGLAHPAEFAATIQPLGDRAVREIMGENLAKLLQI